MSAWISVEERLPDDGDSVLIFHKSGDMFTAWYRTWNEDWCDYNGFLVGEDEVTHWQPLPEPPEEAGER
jgi:hypothetical protein